MVKFQKAKAKVKEYKTKVGILEKENRDLRTQNLSLEKSLSALRDRYELPDFLKPKHLRVSIYQVLVCSYYTVWFVMLNEVPGSNANMINLQSRMSWQT